MVRKSRVKSRDKRKILKKKLRKSAGRRKPALKSKRKRLKRSSKKSRFKMKRKRVDSVSDDLPLMWGDRWECGREGPSPFLNRPYKPTALQLRRRRAYMKKQLKPGTWVIIKMRDGKARTVQILQNNQTYFKNPKDVSKWTDWYMIGENDWIQLKRKPGHLETSWDFPVRTLGGE